MGRPKGSKNQKKTSHEVVIEDVNITSIPEELSNDELFGKDESASDDSVEAKAQEEDVLSTIVSDASVEEAAAKKSLKFKKEPEETPEFVLNELLEAAAEMDEMDSMHNNAENEGESSENKDVEDDFSYLFTDEKTQDELIEEKKVAPSKAKTSKKKKPQKKEKVSKKAKKGENKEGKKATVSDASVVEIVAEDTSKIEQDEIEDINIPKEELPTENEVADEFQAIVSAASSLAENEDEGGYYLFGSQSDDFAIIDESLEDVVSTERSEETLELMESEFVKSVSETDLRKETAFVEKTSIINESIIAQNFEKTTFTYGIGDGKAVFVDENGLGNIIFNNAGNGGLVDWKLVLSETKVIPLFNMAGMNLELPKGDNVRGTLVGKNGATISIFNADNFVIPVDPDTSIAEANPKIVINGDFKASDLDVWDLVLTDTRIISLSDIGDGEIELPQKSSMNGSLVGPDNHMLSFFGVESIVVDTDAQKDLVENKLDNIEEPEFKNLYDDVDVNYKSSNIFSYSEAMGRAEFEATKDVSVVELTTGVDGVYGWNVMFANGVKMGLYDLLKYQSKYGSLPDATGVLSRGQSALKFNGVTRVSVYKKPSYNGYFYGLSA
ncbi:MAG: hypothetical protein GY804_08015 [Alphaproteobacteria bacterium]|nr:hypothetical protein [Alphaproteobacteria bacterium]